MTRFLPRFLHGGVASFSLYLFLAPGAVLLSGLCAASSTRAPQVSAPVVTETAKLFDNTIRRVGDFGDAVAVAGDTLAVGAQYDDTSADRTDGAVSVYERNGAGWMLRQKLYYSNGWPNDTFGNAVALSSDTLVVGARNGDLKGGPQTGSDSDEGFVVVYVRSGDRWVQQQLLYAGDGKDKDYFGYYVALSGDTLVIGNWTQDLARRAAYIFTRSGATWTQRQKLSSHGPIAIFGDTLAAQMLTGLEQSAVQVYTRSGATWTRRQELSGDPSATPFTTGFGSSIALSETHLVVGAPDESAGETESVEGKVYVFGRSGAGWARQQKLAAADAAPHDNFGVSVALAGATLVVGATYSSISARQEAGAAYVFMRDGATWAVRQKLAASDGVKGENFGRAVALSDRVILVGAPTHGRRAIPYIPGAAYVYATAAARPVVNVSAASYAGAALAPESIVAAFGSRLATMTQAAAGALPNSIAGTTVTLKDSAGTERIAPLFFVSPSQINYQIPPGAANGAATVTVTSGDGSVSLADLQIEPVAPGLFTADASGRGLAAAVVLRIEADGARRFEPVAQFDEAQNKLVAAPIDLDNASEQVFLILFGTGLRYHSGLSGVSATVGGVAVEVSFAGAQGNLVGLDQVNLRLPRSLAGRGDVDVALTVNGQAANIVRIRIK